MVEEACLPVVMRRKCENMHLSCAKGNVVIFDYNSY